MPEISRLAKRGGIAIPTEHILYKEVQRRIGTIEELLKIINIRKITYIEHIMRYEKYDVLQLIIKDNLDNGLMENELFREAVYKVMMIANTP